MTILFKEDWKKYPNAIADFKTKNESFLEVSALLKDMRVENYLFPLSLLQPELQGVDPYDENLDQETMSKIWLECKYNFWYFLREVCRFPATTGTTHRQVKANRAIIALCWVLLNNIDLFHMQPRQTGKSAGADAMSIWMQVFRCENATHFLVSKDNGLIAQNIASLKKMREILPTYCYIPDRKDKDIQNYMNYTYLDNEIATKAAQRDPDSALKIGRGWRFATAQIDESPFCPYLDVFLPAMTSAMDASRKEAKTKGEPNFILTTTTAGELNKREGKYAFTYLSNGAPWGEFMYDAKDHRDLEEIVKRNRRGKSMLISAVFTHRMLGMTDKEIYELATKVPSTPDAINRDYFLIWTTGGESSVINPKVLENIEKSEREPNHLGITETGYVIKWYIEEDEIEEFMMTNDVIIASDTSEQVGRDATTFILRSTQSLATLATIRVGEANLITTANWLADFMLKYPRTTLIMERKSTAVNFIDTLLLVFVKNGINPFKRIYNQVIQNPEKYGELYRSIRNTKQVSEKIVNENRRLFGFNQTGNTREHLYTTILQTASRQAQHVVYDKILSGELKGLTVKNGRVDHAEGMHDDMVMAWLLSHWILMFGVNLDYYGIDTKRIFIAVSDEGKQLDESTIMEKDEVDAINQEIDELTAELRYCRHAGLQAKLLHRINYLTKELEYYGVEVRNVDSIVQEIRENTGFRQKHYGIHH